MKVAVTTLGSGVDGSVRRIETAYDGQGNAYLITSYDATTSGNIVNQIQRAFNGLGQMITEWQSHSGAVNTSTTPKVQYTWSEMPSGANHSRLTGIVYPNGRTVSYDYGTGSGLNDTISRLESLKESSTVLEGYSYLGLGTVVVRSHPSPGVDLMYVKRSGESNGDAGDQYIGLDRFGRVVDQRWVVASTGTATDRFQYGYDRDGNRLFRDNLVNTAFGELYSYDGLNQLVSFDRGTLNGGRTAISGSPARSQDWDYDALGNFDSVATNGGSPETRTANAQNEITSISGLITPTYDANGNMTTDQAGLKFHYDAWNRLVTVKNSAGTTTLTSYQYDGTNRRVSENPGTARDLYYSAGWQVLEERVGGSTQVQYVWSPVYIDAQVLRDRDTDANGSLDERLWIQQDANWNVTALVDGSGAVQERYTYDAYGATAIYNEIYVSRGSSLYSQAHLFQGRPLDTITMGYEFRARYYSPVLGRFLNQDPFNYLAGDQNLYRFVSGNPSGFTDPSGCEAVKSPCPEGWKLTTEMPNNTEFTKKVSHDIYKELWAVPLGHHDNWKRITHVIVNARSTWKSVNDVIIPCGQSVKIEKSLKYQKNVTVRTENGGKVGAELPFEGLKLVAEADWKHGKEWSHGEDTTDTFTFDIKVDDKHNQHVFIYQKVLILQQVTIVNIYYKDLLGDWVPGVREKPTIRNSEYPLASFALVICKKPCC